MKDQKELSVKVEFVNGYAAVATAATLINKDTLPE
tara:strand:- start:672 stop:776 length:105 start_codon:yes stop_codon:yes gene_type:complete